MTSSPAITCQYLSPTRPSHFAGLRPYRAYVEHTEKTDTAKRQGRQAVRAVARP